MLSRIAVGVCLVLHLSFRIVHILQNVSTMTRETVQSFADCL